MLCSFWMSWLLCLVAYAWYLSLPLTQVGANTTIYQSASVFVFIFSIFLLNESVTLRKIFSVALSVAGVALIASTPESSGNSEQQDSFIGYVFLIISVLLYALYEVLYKFSIEGEGHQESPSPALLLDGPASGLPLLAADGNSSGGIQSNQDKKLKSSTAMANLLLELEFPMLLSALVGVVSIVSQWPVFFLLDLLPKDSPLYEANNFDFSRGEWVLLGANSFLDSWYYMLLVFGIALTGPVFMSVGVMLVAPVSIVVDWFLHGTHLSVGAWFGVAAVIAGFAVLQVETKFALLERRIVLDWSGKCPVAGFKEQHNEALAEQQ